MGDILSKLDGGEILGLCGIILGLIATLGGISVAITKVIATYYRKVQLDEMDATLKMEMLARGMSAEEITEVLKATSTSHDPPPWAADASKAAAEHCREQRRAMREAARNRGHA